MASVDVGHQPCPAWKPRVWDRPGLTASCLGFRAQLVWRRLSSEGLEPRGSALGGPERGRHPATRRSEVLVSPPEEAQKQKELSKAEMQKVLKEKAQLTADLHSMEKSFSDLFKRFEKQKVVIEGYRKVGAGPAWGRGRWQWGPYRRRG